MTGRSVAGLAGLIGGPEAIRTGAASAAMTIVVAAVDGRAGVAVAGLAVVGVEAVGFSIDFVGRATEASPSSLGAFGAGAAGRSGTSASAVGAVETHERSIRRNAILVGEVSWWW